MACAPALYRRHRRRAGSRQRGRCPPAEFEATPESQQADSDGIAGWQGLRVDLHTASGGKGLEHRQGAQRGLCLPESQDGAACGCRQFRLRQAEVLPRSSEVVSEVRMGAILVR
jgi:hypothetical protein